MMAERERVLKVVVDSRVYAFSLDQRDVPRSLGIRVSVDGDSRWSSEEPGWRDLSIGVEAGSVYWWSARRLMAFGSLEPLVVDVIDAEEDIVTVFKATVGWIIVCETSIRLHAGQEEVHRLELSDVVVGAIWDDGMLMVRDIRGGTNVVSVSAESLDVIT